MPDIQEGTVDAVKSNISAMPINVSGTFGDKILGQMGRGNLRGHLTEKYSLTF